jgi:hypothetical protein
MYHQIIGKLFVTTFPLAKYIVQNCIFASLKKFNDEMAISEAIFDYF